MTQGKLKRSNPHLLLPPISSNAATGTTSSTLIMTCQLLINVPDGSCVKARGQLDSASSTSFVSERLAKALHLPQTSHKVSISGVPGLWHHSSLHPVAEFQVSAVSSPSERF